MKVETAYQGTIEYEQSDLIHFPDGLYGFEHLKYFLPIPIDDGEGSFLSLQSTEEPEISFVIINPFILHPDYSPEPQPQELEKLVLSSAEDASYYLICVLREPLYDSTVDLRCPIVVNPANRKAMQIILNDSSYLFRQPLKAFIRQEVTDAHSAEKRK